MRRKKRVAVPAIETDLSRIQQLSRERDDENWEFRSWLKQHAPDDIDGVVKALSQKYFALIDCTQCANCCRSLHIEFKKSELYTIGSTLGQSMETFQKQSMSEGSVNPPCPMLNGNGRKHPLTDRENGKVKYAKAKPPNPSAIIKAWPSALILFRGFTWNSLP